MGPLSLNSATVPDQWGLAQCIEGCAQHAITGISPWRDGLHAMGVAPAARAIRDAGLQASGLCRGGLFTAPDAAGRQAAIDDNRRAIDEAQALGAACRVRAPWWPTGSTACWTRRGPPGSPWRLSRCTR